MRFNVCNLLRQAADTIEHRRRDEAAYAYMLEQLAEHLALVRDGDWISLDVDARSLQLEVSDDELARRRAAWKAPEQAVARGYVDLFLRHVQQANLGADFDFLVGKSGSTASRPSSVRITVPAKWLRGSVTDTTSPSALPSTGSTSLSSWSSAAPAGPSATCRRPRPAKGR